MNAQLSQDLDELLAYQLSRTGEEFDLEEEEDEEDFDYELERAKLLSQQLNQKDEEKAPRKRRKNNKNYQVQRRLKAKYGSPNPQSGAKKKLKENLKKKNSNNNNNNNNNNVNSNNEEFPVFNEELIDNYSASAYYRTVERLDEAELERIRAQSLLDEEARRERELQEVEYYEAQLLDKSREEYEKQLAEQLNNIIIEEMKQVQLKQEEFKQLQEFVGEYQTSISDDHCIKFRIQFSDGMKEFKMRLSDPAHLLQKLIKYEWMKAEKEKGENQKTDDFQFKLFRSYPRIEIHFDDVNKSLEEIGIAHCESYRLDIL